MIKQNFTQYCIAKGYPSDYDTLFEAQYNGSLGLAGRVSKRTIKSVQVRASENRALNSKAHGEYNRAILAGEIIDPGGIITKEKLISIRHDLAEKLKQGEIMRVTRQIEIIEGLGKMSHLASGKLKLSYQRTVDHYNTELAKLAT